MLEQCLHLHEQVLMIPSAIIIYFKHDIKMLCLPHQYENLLGNF